MNEIALPERQIRAVYDEHVIRVYQAYSDAIADASLKAGRLVSPFNFGRMTWIKPSFLWMMYRAGWGRKDAGQKRVLAIEMSRATFDGILTHGCLSLFRPGIGITHESWREHLSSSVVRVQWDPERNIFLEAQPWRSIQIGLKGTAVRAYVDSIARIEEVTALAHHIDALVESGDVLRAKCLLPIEREYPVTDEVRARLAVSIAGRSTPES